MSEEQKCDKLFFVSSPHPSRHPATKRRMPQHHHYNIRLYTYVYSSIPLLLYTAGATAVYVLLFSVLRTSHVAVIRVHKADEGAVDRRLALILYSREVVVHESHALLPTPARHDNDGRLLLT